jgi:hypothetical protein
MVMTLICILKLLPWSLPLTCRLDRIGEDVSAISDKSEEMRKQLDFFMSLVQQEEDLMKVCYEA